MSKYKNIDIYNALVTERDHYKDREDDEGVDRYRRMSSIVDHIDQLRAKLEITKEALRFYADCENWWWLPSGDKDYMESIATSDMEKIPTEGRARGYETIGGKRARQALKEIRD